MVRSTGPDRRGAVVRSTGPDPEVALNALENRLGVSVAAAHTLAEEARPPPKQPWREPPRG
ncbi:hypothetical protein ABZY05_39110 [Streptomyces canus]|uniref:hypothetical protein n=1 Tax=Streptomyces canus TaxID=58343 RepID=UPI00339FCEB1